MSLPHKRISIMCRAFLSLLLFRTHIFSCVLRSLSALVSECRNTGQPRPHYVRTARYIYTRRISRLCAWLGNVRRKPAPFGHCVIQFKPGRCYVQSGRELHAGGKQFSSFPWPNTNTLSTFPHTLFVNTMEPVSSTYSRAAPFECQRHSFAGARSNTCCVRV